MRNSRRDFIKSAGAATLLLSSAPAVFSGVFTSKYKEKLGVALVGLGYYSTDLLAPALQLTQYCELKGIVTGSPWKIPVWQKKYGIADKNVYNYETMHQIANNPDIDVIYIVLPTGLHSKYSIIAANAGKHVWCEKPMARTAAECEAIIAACNENKVRLSIGYRMQHEPNTRTIIEFAKQNAYGHISRVKAEAGYYDGRSDHWKQKKAMGGGAMYDMGVYPLNAARYATQMEPIAVIARHETNRPEIYYEVDETTYFTLEFPHGVVADCATSLGKGMNELRVDSSKGWYELIPFQAYSGIQGRTSDGKRLNESIANQQARQMDNDALAIMNKTNVIVPGEEGLRDLRIVEAVYKSASLGQRVTL
ncbi:Glucose-fructose oxidoreductase [Fulvivirga imtechensis AK7]|uniref:Glucose-fructose oxidoreductase n=1 Tax=Fulvivirga imtechensis AK7 TaxID=1237149 RepID=L8JZ26_9BACT|nr:Gfo/Idh/MocA family oxidoreductase [Fulvivirga imtechensis]ELR73428.1 Glucose-fructose oxidoreductase [Fulvivirga imtechensis AK7]